MTDSYSQIVISITDITTMHVRYRKLTFNKNNEQYTSLYYF